MRELVAADRIEVLVLVDNVTDDLSSTPSYVEKELPRAPSAVGKTFRY